MIAIFLVWLAGAMLLAWKAGPVTHDKDLELVILFCAFWPIAGILFHRITSRQEDVEP